MLDRKAVYAMLRRRNPVTAAKIDAKIEDSCRTRAAVMMADCSGFTRATHEFGVLPFLAKMVRGFAILDPIIKRHKGRRLETSADNLLAIFPDPGHAVRCAMEMQRALRKDNKKYPENDKLRLCIGIHHGEILRLKNDVFGAAVNIAAKLGEDLADAEQILVTRETVDAAGHVPAKTARSTELGGRMFELFTISY